MVAAEPTDQAMLIDAHRQFVFSVIDRQQHSIPSIIRADKSATTNLTCSGSGSAPSAFPDASDATRLSLSIRSLGRVSPAEWWEFGEAA